MRYKQPVKLLETDYATHIAALTTIADKVTAGNRKPPLADIQQNLEPLILHWTFTKAFATTPELSQLLFNKTGLNMPASSLGFAMRKWGVPTANKTGRGAARPQHNGRAALKF